MSDLSRRRMMMQTGIAMALPLGAAAAEQPHAANMKIIVAGAHPGDPEAGCGGIMARYADDGHEVVALYLTRGEGGVSGKSARQAADIRTAEAQKSCEILKARPLFAGQIDGATEVNGARYDEFTKLILSEKPDVVLTHWPIDHHADHRACSCLTYEAWVRAKGSFALYYYEVDLGSDTQCFHPTLFVDVSKVEPRKRAACMAHASQNPAGGFYTKDHLPMMRFRGMESGFELAEAFIRHDQSHRNALPG